MSNQTEFQIAVFAGDGIGEEIMPACLHVLAEVTKIAGDFSLEYEMFDAGANHYLRTGVAMPEETFIKASEADAILFGAMGMPDIRYPDGREIAPQLDLRERLELYAGVRPVRTFPGLPVPLVAPGAKNLNIVLIRESTEGLFSSRTRIDIENDQVARNTLEITRRGCERLFDFAFRLARKRKQNGHRGHVTCIDKANVLSAFVFFRKIFFEIAEGFPDIKADWCYVDAMALNLIQKPWTYDVVVTENMFGDILSDLGAGIMGGLGMAPSADIGKEHAMFQPCHGSAPNIAGQGKANPTAMFLSAAMMLEWLSDRCGLKALDRAAKLLDDAVTHAFADGTLLPYEFGGTAGLEEITAAVLQGLHSGRVQNKV